MLGSIITKTDDHGRGRLIDALRGALAQGPTLRFAILFGSQARGTARPDSDVDVAFVPVEPLTLAQEHALAAALERAVGAAVDLVPIADAPMALRWRIARDGVVLCSSPPSAASRFLAETGIEHDDLRELEVAGMRRFRAALAREAERAE